MSIQCTVCARGISAANDRIFCFGGCGQVVHAKCADLTNVQALALRENVSIEYMCHDCRKKQSCLNTMMGKCEEILQAISEIKMRVAQIELNCERNNVCDAIKKSEENLKVFLQESIKEQMAKVMCSEDKCLGVDKRNQQNSACAVGDGPHGSNATPSTSYAAVTKSNRRINVNDSVLRSGRIRQRSDISTPKTGDKGHDVQETIVLDDSRKSSKKALDCIVRIKPSVQQTNQQTKKEVSNKINPSQMGVKSVRNGVNGAIVIECRTKNEAEGVMNKVRNELGEHYTAAIEQPKRPRFKILGVEDEYDSEELINILKAQNDIENVQFLRILKTLKHRRGVYNEFTLICESDPGTFEQIMRRGKLYIDLNSCRVTESVEVLRCFKCCGYAHKSQNCRNDPHCARCAGSHDVKECSSEQEKCINCDISNKERKTKLDVNHTAWSFECPIYLKRLRLSKQYIGYEK